MIIRKVYYCKVIYNYLFNLPEVTTWQMFLMYLLINLVKNGISFNMNKKNEKL